MPIKAILAIGRNIKVEIPTAIRDIYSEERSYEFGVFVGRYFSSDGNELFYIGEESNVQSEEGFLINLASHPLCKKHGFCADDFIEIEFRSVRWQSRPFKFFRPAMHAEEAIFPKRTILVDERSGTTTPVITRT